MNAAHRIDTAEISEAELDHVAGGNAEAGVSPHVSVFVGPTSVSDADLLAQAGALQSQLQSTAAQYHGAGVSVSF